MFAPQQRRAGGFSGLIKVGFFFRLYSCVTFYYILIRPDVLPPYFIFQGLRLLFGISDGRIDLLRVPLKLRLLSSYRSYF